MHSLQIVRWILSILLSGFAIYVAICNWVMIVFNIKNQIKKIDRHYSQGPILGPISGYAGLLIMPIHKTWWIWLLPLVDPSTWILLVSLPFLFRELASYSKTK
ncbi:hypothetical protein BH11VER1_BH11VER1_00020 [soil metagenome]